jgi:hypothetical protein
MSGTSIINADDAILLVARVNDREYTHSSSLTNAKIASEQVKGLFWDQVKVLNHPYQAISGNLLHNLFVTGV